MEFPGDKFVELVIRQGCQNHLSTRRSDHRNSHAEIVGRRRRGAIHLDGQGAHILFVLHGNGNHIPQCLVNLFGQLPQNFAGRVDLR